ncbi:Stage II sporulation protein E (SpoIIE) [Rubritalea squalenifaciens DSM 18772]|uniref:Stage II sporulation protein E (SpoIIE) n=1 Tax=Rubritalea squalenifaciens DSM 18772 TaxID=1123071 RepID=A0A1M6H2S8_9BACT|nr:PP2C family protein-serine/threonine phosphatase [Rubritalea squalenifaciens]SHJ16513.1 Stage II sporulation protein E (SpoIIE) [Rubritalea squalenifaciens DSM 18772]
MLKSGKNIIQLVIALAVLSVFVLFVLSNEERFQRNGEKDTESYGQQLAPYLWDVNVETAQEYVEAVGKQNNFHYVEVHHSDGELFVKNAMVEADEGLDGLMRAMGLMRESHFLSPIEYQGREIGVIKTARDNKNIYTYMYMLPVAVLLFTVILLFRTLVKDRNMRTDMELDLNESRHRLHAVMAGTPVIVFSMDQSGVFLKCDGKGLSKIGHESSQFTGKSVEECQGELPITLEDFKKAMDGKIFSRVRKAGSHSFETCYFPLMREERQIGVTGVSTDITTILDAVAQLREKDSELDQEMQLAREAHQSIMSTEVPSVDGLEIGMLFRPSLAVGGDVVRFHTGGGSSIGVTICDIRGHGVAAALVSAAFIYKLDELLGDYRDDFGALYTELNQHVNRYFPADRYAAAATVRVDVEAKQLHYVTGSKEPVVLIRANGKVERLLEPTSVLGSVMNSDYEEKCVSLESGDHILLYTDGLYDVQDAQGLELNRQQMIKWVQAGLGAEPQEVVDQVYRRAAEFSVNGKFRDDVAAVLIKIQ